MRDLTDRALDTASVQGATYADVRVVRRLDESIAIKSGRVEGVASGESEGFGVRVLVDGAWGFAGLARPDRRRSGPGRRRGRPHRPGQRHRPARSDACWTTGRPPAGRSRRPGRSTRSRSRSRRRSRDLLAADEAAARVKGIAFTESIYAAQREWKTFAATDGSFTEQVITHVGAAVEANAIDGDEHQRRSYPDSGGGWQAAGYEYIRGLDLAAHAEPLADEAVALLTAPAVPVRPATRSSSTRRSSTSRSTSGAATRPSSTASSAPRRPTPARAS